MKIGHLRKNHRLGLHAQCLKAALPYDPNFTSVGLMCIKHNASRRFSRGLLRDCETSNFAKVCFQLYQAEGNCDTRVDRAACTSCLYRGVTGAHGAGGS